MSTKIKTGQKVPVSGQYRPAGSKTEVTLVQGKRVPPTTTGVTTLPSLIRPSIAGVPNEISRSAH